jgi:hypothetical protein
MNLKNESSFLIRGFLLRILRKNITIFKERGLHALSLFALKSYSIIGTNKTYIFRRYYYE